VCCGGCGSDSGALLTVGVFGVDLAVLCGLGVVQVRFNGGGRCSDDVIGVIRCSGDGPVVLELRWWLWVEVMRCVGVGSVGFLGFWCWI
jgi:hypothetical protein